MSLLSRLLKNSYLHAYSELHIYYLFSFFNETFTFSLFYICIFGQFTFFLYQVIDELRIQR